MRLMVKWRGVGEIKCCYAGEKRRMFLKVFATLAHSFVKIAFIQSGRTFSFGGHDRDVLALRSKVERWSGVDDNDLFLPCQGRKTDNHRCDDLMGERKTKGFQSLKITPLDFIAVRCNLASKLSVKAISSTGNEVKLSKSLYFLVNK